MSLACALGRRRAHVPGFRTQSARAAVCVGHKPRPRALVPAGVGPLGDTSCECRRRPAAPFSAVPPQGLLQFVAEEAGDSSAPYTARTDRLPFAAAPFMVQLLLLAVFSVININVQVRLGVRNVATACADRVQTVC